MRNDKFFKIDLHVHTFASNDFQGQKNIEEYKNMLKSAIENNVDLICITDHSSVKGYKEIFNQKNSLSNLLQQLRERSDVDSNFLKNIENELNVFNQIHILMGIEIKLTPGIHYIIVFEESVDPDEVESFFKKITNGEIEKNIGSDEYMLQIDPINFFGLVKGQFKNNCFIYAPHADSDSGIIEGLKKFGAQRLIILNNEDLLCIGFNKEKTKEYVKENLIKDRKRALNFIQDSDFHGRAGEQVGSLYFLIEKETEKINFNLLLKRILKNKDVITSSDQGKDNYESFIKNKIIFPFNNFAIDTISSETTNELCITLCALLNSEPGFIEFDVNLDEQIDVKSFTDNLIDKLRDLIIEKIDYFPHRISYTFFLISKSKFRILLNIGKSRNLKLYNGICYFIDKSGKIKKAESNEIESIVAKKIYERFAKSNDFLLNEINANSTKMINFLDSLSTFYKIENKTKYLNKINIDILKNDTLNEEINEIIENQPNGFFEGNLIVLSGLLKINCGRYTHSYLRITPPTFIYDLTKIDSKVKLNKIEKNTIIISVGGACYLTQEEVDLVSEYLVFKISGFAEIIDPNVLIAYLKSSFFQWLISKIHDYTDLFDFCLKTGIPSIPIIADLFSEKNIDLKNISKNIVLEEKNFLRESEKIKDNKDNKEQSKKLLEKHNNKCDDYLRSIDKFLFELLGFSNREIKRVLSDLKNMKIYEYDALENFEKLYEKK